MGVKRPKFGAEGAVLESFGDILEKLRNNWKIGNKKRKLGYIWLFRGAAGTAKYFNPLSTRYFGIFSRILSPPHQIFDGGTAPIISKILGQVPPTKISYFRPWVRPQQHLYFQSNICRKINILLNPSNHL